MKCNLIFPFASFMLLMTSCVPPNTDTPQQYPDAPSQVKQACGRDWQLPLTEIKGIVKREYYAAPPWTEQKGLHLEVIDTSTGKNIIIHVFPEKCVRNNPEKFHFEAGQIISVAGSEFFTESGTQMNICAASIDALDTWLRDNDNGTVNNVLCSDKPECKEICSEQCRSVKRPEKCIDQCMDGCKSR